MAEAVLLKDVDGLGEAGDPIDVSPGYLRNYLVPRKLAQPATKGALEEAERRRERAEEAERQAAERADETAALLSKTVLTISHRAGEDGKLFGSVTAAEIADAIQAARGLKVDRRKIRLEEPIRETGTFMVEVEVGGGVTASLKTIVAEEHGASEG
jgi:large subunit ribosomal protein L9